MPALSKLELCELLPHGESMCLLDSVETWDSTDIVCVAKSHRDKHNPLRNNRQLHSICGLEYAAQTMAVHVGLTKLSENIYSYIGFLGAVRELQVGTSRLDCHSGPLRISGNLLINQGHNFMYHFTIEFEGKTLLQGRASIFIPPRLQAT